MSEDDCENDNCDNGPNVPDYVPSMIINWWHAPHINRNSEKEGGNLGDISVCT